MNTDTSIILQLENLVKYYGSGENLVRAVDHTSLEIERGRFTAVVGRSGSGKSTLLHLYGVTYPTVRLRLDKLIQKIKINDDIENESYISLIKKNGNRRKN